MQRGLCELCSGLFPFSSALMVLRIMHSFYKHDAAVPVQCAMSQVLLEWSSSISARNKKGLTPIHIVCLMSFICFDQVVPTHRGHRQYVLWRSTFCLVPEGCCALLLHRLVKMRTKRSRICCWNAALTRSCWYVCFHASHNSGTLSRSPVLCAMARLGPMLDPRKTASCEPTQILNKVLDSEQSGRVQCV